jgi:hypothetical protein
MNRFLRESIRLIVELGDAGVGTIVQWSLC